jgi:hypothetical protein
MTELSISVKRSCDGSVGAAFCLRSLARMRISCFVMRIFCYFNKTEPFTKHKKRKRSGAKAVLPQVLKMVCF